MKKQEYSLTTIAKQMGSGCTEPMPSSRYSTPLRMRYTITFYNGDEFNQHGEIAKQLHCGTYFAKPYHSWEHGLNENHNGLLRQFFPKKMRLYMVTEKETKIATDLMNNRPRKCLGFKTPFEVFAGMIGKDRFFKHSVALVSCNSPITLGVLL